MRNFVEQTISISELILVLQADIALIWILRRYMCVCIGVLKRIVVLVDSGAIDALSHAYPFQLAVVSNGYGESVALADDVSHRSGISLSI